MRKDIEIHINTGDITLSPRNDSDLYPFAWVSNPDGLSRYMYGEITIPANISEARIKSKGVHVNIPYTPVFKEFCIRIKREYGDGSYAYVYNPVDGSEWYVVQSAKYGSEMANVYASELITISNQLYYIRFNSGKVELYAYSESDVRIIKANRQNANMLLKCLPTNCYRYPLIGVGLIRWTQGNANNTSLADVLQREFEADGVRVNNAVYDFETNDLYLDLDTTNLD